MRCWHCPSPLTSPAQSTNRPAPGTGSQSGAVPGGHLSPSRRHASEPSLFRGPTSLPDLRPDRSARVQTPLGKASHLNPQPKAGVAIVAGAADNEGRLPPERRGSAKPLPDLGVADAPALEGWPGARREEADGAPGGSVPRGSLIPPGSHSALARSTGALAELLGHAHRILTRRHPAPASLPLERAVAATAGSRQNYRDPCLLRYG